MVWRNGCLAIWQRASFRGTLANLTRADGDVGAVLMREELAVRYKPGKGPKAARIAHWCGN